MKTEGDCRTIKCCGPESGNFGYFVYSLVAGQSYTNEEITFIVDCPPGYQCDGPTVTIPLPPGSINFQPVDIIPNDPGPRRPSDPEPGIYTFRCGTQTLVIALAPGAIFSAAQITQIIAFLAECEGDRIAIPLLNPIPNTRNFTNDAVYASCSATGSQLTATGALPAWIIIELNATGNRLAGKPGAFSGASKVAATAAAQTALNLFLATSLVSGLLLCSCFINGATLPPATLGDAYAATFFPSSGMIGVFTIISGALPDGLTLNSASGLLSGVPTVAGNYTFEIAFSPT